MTVDLDEFIKKGTNVKVGLNEWSNYKENLQEDLTKTLIITSKSCKKYISGINPEKVLEVQGEPTFQSIDNSLKEIYPIYKKIIEKNDEITLIAVGGGSVIDTAKILSLMLSNNIETALDALEKSNTSELDEKIKTICVPSTAGTGAETTQFSTIWDKSKGLKFSIVSNKLNRTIILDPELSLYLPNQITISTGIDALCQLLESTWSKKADKFSIKTAKLGYQILKNNIAKITDDPKNQNLRLSMLISSYLSGISISKANTTLCHSISYPLTALLEIPHGLACGLTLIETIRFNSKENDKFIKRTLEATNNDNSQKLIEEINDLLGIIKFKKLMKPHLSRIEENLIDYSSGLRIAYSTINERASNNPRPATSMDIERILRNSLNNLHEKN